MIRREFQKAAYYIYRDHYLQLEEFPTEDGDADISGKGEMNHKEIQHNSFVYSFKALYG